MSGESAQTVAAGQLRAFIERVERIEEEIKAANDDKKEIYAEAKGSGFDVPTIKRVVSARRKDSAQREEEDALFDLYWSTLNGAPSHVQAQARARVEIIDEFQADAGPADASPDLPEHDTETGELIEESERGGGAPDHPSLAAREADEDAAPHSSALVAQRIEQEASNLSVAGSTPAERPTSPAASFLPAAGRADDAANPPAVSSANLSPSAGTSPTADLTGEAPKPPETQASPVSTINERCQKPDSCKYARHPHKLTCASCTTAWLLKTRAQRESEAA